MINLKDMKNFVEVKRKDWIHFYYHILPTYKDTLKHLKTQVDGLKEAIEETRILVNSGDVDENEKVVLNADIYELQLAVNEAEEIRERGKIRFFASCN